MSLWSYKNKPASQLEKDTLAVFIDKTAKLQDFSLKYQEKIKSTWRFSSHRYSTTENRSAPRCPQTLDFV